MLGGFASHSKQAFSGDSAVQAEFQRQASSQVFNFICDEERELFDLHQAKVQAFLGSPDGADVWGFVVEAFRAFLEPPAVSGVAE
ncbi:hypothetical protein EAH78_18185 [Pseudomonas arsenicoxydans]|uniref:Uncharacterized protein n=1 Tax=Pseudomonas arsenicoxydans TaxID=702115 RepID=A0A502HRL4_9PSED|nr:hypothetical protein EAH78_18185 [Pseudomonas arsenicoxydans]